MVITNTPRAAGPYFGDDVADTFAYNFRVLTDADLEVRLSEDGVPTVVLELGTDYTVTGADSDTGGDVVLNTPLATGQRLDILGAASYTQPLSLENQGPYFARDVMRALDRIVVQTQQLAEAVGRAIIIPPEDDVTDIASLIAAVTALDAIRADLTDLAGIIADIEAVSGIAADVSAVAAITAAVSNVSSISANIAAVVAVDTEIVTLSTVAADIALLGPAVSEIVVVAALAAQVAILAAIETDITTVAGVAADVVLVADALANIAIVVANIAAIDTVADNIASVNTVSTNIASVNTVASNIASILAALAGAVLKTSATGSAILPVGTTAQRDGTPATGYLRYNTTTGSPELYNGSSWGPVGGGGQFRGNNGLVGVAPGDIFRINAKTLTANTTIGATENAGAVGPLTVDTGVTLEIATGGTLVIT